MALAYFIQKTVYKIKKRTKKSSKLSSETLLSSPVVTRSSPNNTVHNTNVFRDDTGTENIFAVKKNDKTNNPDENPVVPESTKIVMVDMEVVRDEDAQDNSSRIRQADENKNLTNFNGTDH